jgi:hypothetical protein
MKNAPAPAPAHYFDKNGIRWLKVEPTVCHCADCSFERKHGVTLRTAKQCQA